MAFKMKGIKFYSDNDKFVIDKSDIDGSGVIASQNIKKGEFIGTAITDEASVRADKGVQHDTRTRLGQKLNHQDKENAIQKSENNALNVYAKNSISEGEEITINYINAPDYVDKTQVAGYKK
jgi:SET domain-containing protein